MKRLVRHPAAQAAFARILGLYLRFALATTRWRLEGLENLAPVAEGTPHIVAVWHERLAIFPQFWRFVVANSGSASPRGCVLISPHRDGRMVGAVLSMFGISAVEGSSSRGGLKAQRRLLELLAEGSIVGITPDGPRGPARQAAPGLAQLAALAGVPILPCGAQTSHHFRLRSWDRMVFPWPFGKGVVVCLPPIAVPRQDWRAAVPGIGAALTAAADEADRLCPA